jgi:hypothetical protein
MGMHFGLLAVRATVVDLKQTVAKVWPRLERGRSRSGFVNFEEVWTWAQANHEFVSAAKWSADNPGSDVVLFYQDKSWAVMVDRSVVQVADQAALGALSASLGPVVSFVIETTSGCAYFWYFENGGLRRSIEYIDGDLKTVGEALAEEAGFAAGEYYMNETEALMSAFGLTPYGDESLAARVEACEIIDRTDYSKMLAAQAPIAETVLKPPAERAPVKSWWRFW